MNKQIFFFLFLIFLMALSQSATGKEQTSGMHFLLMGPSAYNMGASDGHTASLTGASGIFLNPALLAMEKSNSASVSYMIWPATDTQNSFAGIVYQKEKNAFGFALLSSLNDDIPFRRSASQNPDGYFAVRYLSLAGSYARSAGPFSAGITGMYLYEQFFQQDASGYGLNAGLALNLFDERVRIGAALRNIGSMDELAETATKLPARFSVGTDIRLLQFSTSALEDEIPLLVTLSADYNLPLNEISDTKDGSIISQGDGYLNTAVELNISEIIDLRMGYRTGDTQRRFSFGSGLLVSDFYFNYAFMPFNDGFGVAHAISLQYNF